MKNLKKDRCFAEIRIDANHNLTNEQWDQVTTAFALAIEDCISESPKRTDWLGHVLITTDRGADHEICV